MTAKDRTTLSFFTMFYQIQLNNIVNRILA